jgi:hypothetical protein
MVTKRKYPMAVKRKVILSEPIIKDITFFEEDLTELSNQLTSAEALYRNLYGQYENLTGGKYITMKSPRDIAEFAKALVQIRSLCTDTAFKRHQIRKNVSDITHRNSPDETSDDLIKEAARTIISEVRGYIDNPQNRVKPAPGSPRSLSEGDRDALDSKVQEYIDTGDISLSTNDKLIGLADHVKFKYDKAHEEFVAVDGRTDAPISGFPAERLPTNKISRITRHEAIANTGVTYELYGED